MLKMGSLSRKLILVCIVACCSIVQSYPQGSSDGDAPAGDARSPEVQALIDACPCFDYTKMCASPPPTTEASPTTTTSPEQDDDKAATTTAAPEESPEATTVKDDEAPTTAAPEDAPTTTPKDDAAATTPAPEESPSTEKVDETTEAPAAQEEPKAADARQPKKLDTAPADLTDQPADASPNSLTLDQNALDSLQKLLAELNEKLRKLEESHENLNKNIAMLEDRLKEYEKLIPEVQNTTTEALTNNNPEKAVEQWKNLQTVIDDPNKLQNVTNDIVNTACDRNVPPQDTMNFIHNLPTDDTTIVDSAYNTLADNMANSDQLQEHMYWRDMTPYCQAVAQDVGPQAPTTEKMHNLQNQMRLNAAQPIKQCSQQINQQQYEPALDTWNNMTVDISDSPNQLKTNMEKLILKSYDGDADSLPYVFQFVFILPEEQVEYKDVAFECLRNEMNNNGHSFIYPQQNLQQQGPPGQPNQGVYNYKNNY